jgi:hypothetical protein
MRKETINIYDLNDLSPEARAKAIDAHRNLNVCDTWWTDMIPAFNERLEKAGLESGTIYWDLDGGAIWSEPLVITDLDTLVSAAGLTPNKRFHEPGVYNEEYISLYLKGSRHRQNSFMVMETNKEERKRIERALNTLLSQLFIAIYDEIQKEYDYLISDEQVAESLSANGYEFVANGEDWQKEWEEP